MNRYNIYEKSMGTLSRTSGPVSDKFGNTRRHLIYWTEYDDKENITYNYLSVMWQYLLIKILARDLNPIIIKLQKEAEDE